VKVVAPGKLLLFGAYAVLEGAPAIVVSVDRYAVADPARVDPAPSREVLAAFGAEPAPLVDATALYDGAAKLGLGSSAAVLVASLGARAASRGQDLTSSATRKAIFQEARAAHAAAQGGGSGVDIAASTFGGALAYVARPEADARADAITLPQGLSLVAFWSGVSARTSELRARVEVLRARDARTHAAALDALADASRAALGALADLPRFVAAAAANARALASLGRVADAPVVPEAFGELATLAERSDAAFYPSGAGGGDVGVWIGAAPPPPAFLERCGGLGMHRLGVGMEAAGVRTRED
jgi:phosphomevalonate kinase